MNVMTTEGGKKDGAGNRIAALTGEMAGVINDLPESLVDQVRKKMAFFLNAMILAESAPDNDALHDGVAEAWQEVARAPAFSLSDVALQARATMLYREGQKTWDAGTFCDDDWQYLQQIIEGAAEFALT